MPHVLVALIAAVSLTANPATPEASPATVLLLRPPRAADPGVLALAGDLERLLEGNTRFAVVSDQAKDGEPAVASQWAIEVAEPTELHYRSLSDPERRGHLIGTAPELIAELECRVFSCSTVEVSRLAFEPSIGLSVGPGEGIDALAALGGRLRLSRRWALVLDARVQAGNTRISYPYYSGPGVIATRLAAVGGTLGLRATLWQGELTSVALSLSPGAWAWFISNPTPLPGSPLKVRSTARTTPNLGAVASLSLRRQLSERWTVVVGLDYSLLWVFQTSISVDMPFRGTTTGTSLNSEALRHEVSLRFGLWL